MKFIEVEGVMINFDHVIYFGADKDNTGTCVECNLPIIEAKPCVTSMSEGFMTAPYTINLAIPFAMLKEIVLKAQAQ